MSSRAIHLDRSYFITAGDPLLIPDQGIIKFTHQLWTYHTKIKIGNIVSDINQILFNFNTSTLTINTSSVTFNNFIVYWSVCLKTASSTLMPCFSVVVRKSDNSIFTTLSSNNVMKANVVYGCGLLHLPTPAPADGQVSYSLTVVNTTGDTCCYSTKAFTIADIMIVCIDD